MTTATRLRMAAAGVAGGLDWDALVASLGPWQWLKLDDAITSTVAADASGNGRTGSYPNGANPLFPDRREPPLVDNSGFSLISGGLGNSELITPNSDPLELVLTAGSFTFGGVVASTITAALAAQWAMNGFRVSLAFNMNVVTPTNGALRWWYDSGGANADNLSVTGTGWNDGANHLIFCEYNSVADTMTIWKDGVAIGTRARPGTKPTQAVLNGAAFQILGPANNTAGMKMDEWLMFDKVLTPGEHAELASHVL